MPRKNNRPGTVDISTDSGQAMRKQAEETAQGNATQFPENIEAMLPGEIRQMLHELRVHQIELEMQHEELLRIQGELDASRERYFDLYNLAPVGYFTLSEKGLILEANLTAATLLEVPRNGLVKQPISRFLLKEDQDIYYLHRKQLLETSESQECELRMVKKDGSPFWAHLASTVVQEDSGATVFRVTMSDISHRKRAEADKAKLEAQLHQAQKTESVGRLAGGVAHDFNNMLGVIIGHTEMALKQVSSGQTLHADLQEIRKAAERSADLTRQLLAFASGQTIAPRVLDLNETIESLLKMLKRVIGEEIDILWKPGENIWPIRMDPSQIDQILVNLCLNARDAITGVGKVTLGTKTIDFDEAYCRDHPEFSPGEYTMLVVSDDGCGMDAEMLEKLFEPFFTTKELGKGVGLGLATIYGIVKQNNGFINVYSEPDRGTTFRIYLPRYTGQVEPLPPESPPEPMVLGHETILLVEDEPAMLDMAVMMLENLGYIVLPARTPGEAIGLAREHAGKIHLLLTDVMMPEMNGWDLAKNLRPLCPKMKRLFMSGHTADIIAHHGVLEDGVYFLQKPFYLDDLSAKVREALESE
jgi:PAS domain S-box-containing protein